MTYEVDYRGGRSAALFVIVASDETALHVLHRVVLFKPL